MTFFYGPLYFAVTCLALGFPEEYNMWNFRETTSGFMSVFSSLLGLTVDTYVCQYMEALVLGSCDRFSSCSLFPVYSALLGSTVDTCFSSFYEEFPFSA